MALAGKGQKEDGRPDQPDVLSLVDPAGKCSPYPAESGEYDGLPRHWASKGRRLTLPSHILLPAWDTPTWMRTGSRAGRVFWPDVTAKPLTGRWVESHSQVMTAPIVITKWL